MNIPITKRRCCKCDLDKPLTDFHRDRTRSDGYYPQCKACRVGSVKVRVADTVRVCRRCGESKTSSDFHRDIRKADGLHPYCKACVKAFQVANADHQNQYGHNWQKENADKVRKYTREWARRNPDTVRQNQDNYRARHYNAEGSFTMTEWRALCDWFGNVCLACGKPEVSVDHVVPLVVGGSNYLENLQPLCPACNTSKKAKTIDYRNPDRLAAFFRIYYEDDDPLVD